ncbi:hypothetical protein M406DRAFT_75343 [Cryphonectria parasitica EP155]|uniref:Uncharacterized protein n=1 Tax=Cryphonectria parasitica (strain ATCC 38755 / EP155) TaxID=660469 RepID=A0A9P4XSI5_CRYP1|nr:uncharacterized protein M406DRAFT_75343 [Cryphonectria parasitica EP155]KAF3759970.1 hypothetical protein M406DRAFT_75343 [Cryphonectria parasitica EP155]
MTVEAITCDWRVKSIMGKASNLAWAKQATGPMPLEAIHYLINLAVTKQRNVLIGTKASNLVYVTKEFFQESPLGIEEATVKDDVLGFFSLVLTYAKAAGQLKQWPQAIFKEAGVTSCRENDYDQDEKKLYTIADPNKFCDLINGKMVPSNKLFRGKMSFTYDFTDRKSKTALEKDSLAEDLDRLMLAQMGNLEQKPEYLVDTQRPVPLFEFRGLGSSTAATMEKDVKEIEDMFLELHKKYETAPTAFTKWWKRAESAELIGIGGHTERGVAQRI